jgi:hypothetical protein
MADAVKITVIATGFQPEHAPVADRRSQPEIRIQARLPQPAPAIAPEPVPVVVQTEPEPEPEPALITEAEPMVDSDDIETPAYMRQGRLLN